jgi:hypothetical protein
MRDEYFRLQFLLITHQSYLITKNKKGLLSHESNPF